MPAPYLIGEEVGERCLGILNGLVERSGSVRSLGSSLFEYMGMAKNGSTVALFLTPYRRLTCSWPYVRCGPSGSAFQVRICVYKGPEWICSRKSRYDDTCAFSAAESGEALGTTYS